MNKLNALIHKILANKKITSNIGWLILDKFVRLGVNFVLSAWIARYLGKELFGLWSYTIALVILFSATSTLGLYNILLRDYLNKTYPLNQLIGSAFFIKLLGGMVTVLSAYVCILLMNSSDTRIHQLVLITGMGYIVQSLDVIDCYFQSQLKARFTILARVGAFAVISICKVYAILHDYPLESFVWLTFFELCLSAIFLLLIFQVKVLPVFHWKIRLDIIKYLLRASFPIMLTEMAIVIYLKIDQLMIREFIDIKEVGEYAAAARLSEIWYLFPAIISSSIFPSITEVYQLDKKLYYQKIQNLYRIMAMISLSIAAVTMIFSGFLVDLFYGEEFKGASYTLSIHVWAGIFVFLSTASGQQLVIENLMRYTLYKTLFGLCANIILNLILIPRLQSEGAALATLISYGIEGLLAEVFFNKTRKVFFLKLKAFNVFKWPQIFS